MNTYPDISIASAIRAIANDITDERHQQRLYDLALDVENGAPGPGGVLTVWRTLAVHHRRLLAHDEENKRAYTESKDRDARIDALSRAVQELSVQLHALRRGEQTPGEAAA